MLGLLGTAVLARERKSPEVWLVVGALALFPLAYYLIHALERYRFPIEPLLLLAAAWLLLRWRGGAASKRPLAPGAPPGHHGLG
jgi:hypothetical protein